MFKNILVAFDGSKTAWEALRHGIQLAREHDAHVWALSVEEPLPHYASAAEEVLAEETLVAAYFEELLTSAYNEAANAGITLQTETVRGHASRAIVQFAEQIEADLIIVGQHGHAGILDRMLGSTSDRVVDTATCSVLVVPSELQRP
jgi:nucleotide-binding universal stress UspA family protein